MFCPPYGCGRAGISPVPLPFLDFSFVVLDPIRHTEGHSDGMGVHSYKDPRLIICLPTPQHLSSLLSIRTPSTFYTRWTTYCALSGASSLLSRTSSSQLRTLSKRPNTSRVWLLLTRPRLPGKLEIRRRHRLTLSCLTSLAIAPSHSEGIPMPTS